MLLEAMVADEVTERVPATALVVVTLVNTPVLGVVAPIGVFSIVPPLIVSASATLLSPNEPVMEPKLPRAKVTLAFPSVPEFTAVAETLPVASIVRVLEIMASVMLLAGNATVPVTLIFPAFKLAMLDEEMVVVLKDEVAENVLSPVNVLLPLRYAKFAESERLLLERPVTEPVIARVPVTVRLPAFSEAMLELEIVVVLKKLLFENVFCPVNVWSLAKYARVVEPVTLLMLMVRPVTVAPVKFADEVTVNTPITAWVVVDLVNTPVLGVVAPIGVFSMVPPLIVRASATLLSPSEPVIEPNDPSARVTLAFPNVPEFMAVAETLPVASIVSVFETIASVTLFAGSETVPVTVMLPAFRLATLELANVFAPVNTLLFARYASDDVPASWLTLIPVMVVPVNARVPVIVVLPRFAEAILELAKVFAPVKILVFAKYAIDEVPERLLIAMPETVPVTFRLPTFAEAMLLEAMVADEVTERVPATALVVVTLVNTPVLGVVAPIGVFSIVPPLIVRASEMLLSPNEPVIEPNEPSARVTLAFPNVPEFTAVAETLPVASIVRVLDTMASVMLLAGRATVPVTLILPAFRLATLELANVLAPEKMLLLARYASDDVPASWLTLMPVIVVPVNARVPVMVVLPRFADAILLEANVFAPVKMFVFAR
jgi:hypothetical protein